MNAHGLHGMGWFTWHVWGKAEYVQSFGQISSK